MRRYSLSTCIATALTTVVSLVAASGAQAVRGQPTANSGDVTYGVTHGSYAGHAVRPAERANTGPDRDEQRDVLGPRA